MSSATKQKSSAGKNVLIFFIVFIILEMLIVVGVGRVFKNKNVITSNMTPSTDKIGEAVVCENVPDIGTSVFWLYDITSTDDNNGVVYTVYQEKDPAKLYEISSKNVVGVASTYYMTAGKVLTFMSSTFGMIVCAVVPIFLLVVIELIIAIATHSSDDEEEDDDEEEPAESVTLDDFLFGGENEGEQIEETIFERPAEKEERAEIDRSYYERASQLLDEAASTEDTVAPEPEKKPVPKAKPAAKPAQQTKTASASLEELMKLMEQEQEKLKKQLDKK